MSGSQIFPQSQLNDLNNQLFTDELLSEHVTLITRVHCNDTTLLSTLDQIYHQFKETKKALFIQIYECESDTPNVSGKNVLWYDFFCPDTTGFCDSLLMEWPDTTAHALVDREKRIRSYYSSHTKEEKRILLEHMALLLPRERSEKVELKRGEGK